MKAVFLGALIGALLAAAPARADTPPSAWDLAKDPSARLHWEIHTKVEQLVFLDETVEGRGVQTIALERARVLLEDAGAARSPDPRLRFDLGLVYEKLRRHAMAAEVLQAAVDAFPHHPAVKDALENLAFAYAYLDRSREERVAYLRLLPLEDDPRAKGIQLLNLAEAEMHLGNLDEAVQRYRESIRVSEEVTTSQAAYETRTLAVWGLAVALDRAGDPQASHEEAKLATQMDAGERTIGNRDHVFFVPEYERDWYFGLAQAVHAEEAPSAREALDAWTRAVEYWNHYVTSADPSDRWVALARSHLARARQKRVELAARVAKQPPVPPREGDGAIHVIP